MSDEEILRFIRDLDDPVVGSSEIAEEFDYSQNWGATKRLQALADEGWLDSKKLSQTRAWWITEDGLDRLD